MNEVFIRTMSLPNWLADKYFNGKDLYTVEELIALIEDLDADIERLNEELKHLNRDIEDNYKFINQREAIDYNENW